MGGSELQASVLTLDEYITNEIPATMLLADPDIPTSFEECLPSAL
jgi:hypothetical protein